MAPKIAPYGRWTSPISKEIVSGSNLSFAEVHTNPSTASIYLLEGRPAEKGRVSIVQFKDGKSTDILPKEYNVRSKVHEYGGAAAQVTPDGSIVFTDFATSGVFSLSRDHEVTEIIKGDEKMRYANFDIHPTDHGLMVAVQEDHTGSEVINRIALIDVASKTAKIVVEGADFYSHPKWNPDGTKLSWLQWNHPDMPWTGSELYVAAWEDRKVTNATKIAGKAREESICQPKWHTDGSLLFCSDRTGFWQLYRFNFKVVDQLVMHGYTDVEFGGNEFILGCNNYISLNDSQLVVVYTRKATTGFLLYDLDTKTATELDVGIVNVPGCALKKVSDKSVAVIGGTLDAPIALYYIEVTNAAGKKMLKSSSAADISTAYLSKAESIEFPRTHGADLNSSSYAIYIPPQNPDFEAEPGTKPPMIVSIHGGPTSHVTPGLSLGAQYYTSRGYAYCYINYAGSTGYGRKYRAELDYNWGLKDCEDTVSCIDYLSSKGLIDGSKVGITGGSAGGYTTLQAMCTFPKSFAAGCSLYGVGNLKSLAADTHKFESQYLFALLFPEGTPEAEQEKIYYDRSPCFHAKNIERPLVLLQGDIDMVVPLAQAEEMERILKEEKRDVTLVVFKNEGHGFKMQENIKRAIEEEQGLWERTLL